jgi:hypothetical protein
MDGRVGASLPVSLSKTKELLMKPRYFPIFGSLFAFTAAGTLLMPQAATAQEAGPVEVNEDVEVLTRGPVHEAFAESVSFEAEAGFTISSAPPELIEELPPDQQPEGENVTWIPGYWAWDDDQSDFLWISGVWRNIPPGRQWVPGYWNDLGTGSFQWISGYWADTTTEEVEYVETAPPKSIEAGPNIAAPSEDHTWVPGNWMWSTTRYVWRPGYWLALRPNWTWVPSRHCWTPRGYVYVDGYWDYAVVNRGVLFAPIHFRRHVWSTPGYYYRPSIVVSLNVFSDHLFIRPRHRHYYFGDYYAPRYRDSGFYASFHWHRHHHRGYDPIYAYQRWNHRHDNRWERRHEDNYNYFRDNDRFRPPHTWAAMRGLRGETFDNDRGRSRLFANSFDGIVKSPERGQKFRAVDKARSQQFVAQRQEMRNFSRQRRDMETKRPVTPAPAGGDPVRPLTVREKLRRSPVVGRQAEQFAKSEAPPKRPEARGNALRQNRGGKAGTPEPRAPGLPETARRGNGNDDTARPGRPGREVTPKERTREMPDRSPATGTDGKTTPPDRTRRTPQVTPQTRETPKRQVTPERKVQPQPRTRETPKREVTPERKVQPQPRTRETPKRQVTPERKVQPQPRETPKRQVTPERKVQPQPQRQPQRQVQPQRQPQRQPQVRPERKPQEKQQIRQVPQRRPEPNAQRIAQPKPQARPQPQQRQVQPRQQQARPQPQQRQVQPRQQQARPQPQQRQVQPRQQQARPQPQQRQVQPRQQQARPQPQQRQVQPRQQPQQRQNQKERNQDRNRG